MMSQGRRPNVSYLVDQWKEGGSNRDKRCVWVAVHVLLSESFPQRDEGQRILSNYAFLLEKVFSENELNIRQ